MAASKDPKGAPDRPLAVGMGAVAAVAAGVIVFAIVSLFRGDDSASSSVLEGRVKLGDTVAGERPTIPGLPGDGEPSLTGRVLDTAGVGIEGVALTIEAERAAPWKGAGPSEQPGGLVIGGAVVAASTDAEGRFRFAGLGAGLYRVRIEGPTVVTAEVRFLQVPVLDLDITALRQIRIGGKVTMPAGGAVATVTVIARGELGEERAFAETDGTFSVLGLPEGVYRVWAEGSGLASPAKRVEARGAGPFDSLELALQETVRVHGQLRDRETGAALAGSVVFTSESDEPERRAESDAQGNYEVGSLLPGRWTARAQAPGYVPSEQVVFGADRERTLDLLISRGGTIEGIALDPDGAPVEGAVIEALAPIDEGFAEKKKATSAVALPATAPGTQFIQRGELGVLLGPIPFPPPAPLSATRVAQPIGDDDGDGPGALGTRRLTDGAGQFRIGGLRAGSYRVVATHPDFAGGVTTGVVVALGVTATVRIAMRRGTRVRGVVASKGGGPIAGAVVTATVSGAPELRATTEDDGSFLLPPLIGAATIRASALGFAEAKKLVPVLADGGEKTVQFELERADKVLAGRVSDSAGLQVRGARVSLPSGVGDTTDDSGRFEIPSVPGGKHTLQITHPKFPPLSIVVATGEQLALKLPIGGGISGRVRDERSGYGIAEATVEARNGDTAIAVRTNEHGEFAISPLAAATWKVTVVVRKYARLERSITVPVAPNPGEVTVSGVKLELARGAILGGVVRDENGERVAKASVKVGEMETTTDIDGRFRLLDVPARGRTEIRASAGDRSGSETIELYPGDARSSLDVRISPNG